VVSSDYAMRFGGIQRLVGALAQERLRRAHVCVVGIGGVGSWTVEALARSGIGALTLIDLDEVCVSNINPPITGAEPARRQTQGSSDEATNGGNPSRVPGR
jgi:tRNA A37 threonylcarbamoyladenosine dehydratase